MANYMVEAPHTDAQCLAAMDEIVAEQPQLLAELSWGCMSGVHTGWANVEAESESAVRSMLPASQRDSWGITKVEHFTEEQIRAEHEA